MRTQNRRQSVRRGGWLLVAVCGFWMVHSGSAAVVTGLIRREDVRFSDDFDDNASGWSDIGAGDTQATIGTDPGSTTEGVWYPTVEGGGSTTSRLTLPSSVNIQEGSIGLYANVRVDRNGGGNGRFRFAINGGTEQFALLHIEPGTVNGVVLEYRDLANTVALKAVLGTYSFPNFTDFVTFGLTLTDNGNGSMTIQAYKRDLNDTGFVAMGAPVTDARLKVDGLFTGLSVYNRNALGQQNLVYFDSITATQMLPPMGTVFTVR